MFDQLRERGLRHAEIDVDALCLSNPPRSGDPAFPGNDAAGMTDISGIFLTSPRVVFGVSVTLATETSNTCSMLVLI